MLGKLIDFVVFMGTVIVVIGVVTLIAKHPEWGTMIGQDAKGVFAFIGNVFSSVTSR